MQHVSPKHFFPYAKPDGVTSQKTIIFVM